MPPDRGDKGAGVGWDALDEEGSALGDEGPMLADETIEFKDKASALEEEGTATEEIVDCVVFGKRAARKAWVR